MFGKKPLNFTRKNSQHKAIDFNLLKVIKTVHLFYKLLIWSGTDDRFYECSLIQKHFEEQSQKSIYKPQKENPIL